MKLKRIKMLSFMVVVVSLLCSTAFAQSSEQPSAQNNENEVSVMCSGGFYSTLQELAPIYEKNTGKKLF